MTLAGCPLKNWTFVQKLVSYYLLLLGIQKLVDYFFCKEDIILAENTIKSYNQLIFKVEK